MIQYSLSVTSNILFLFFFLVYFNAQHDAALFHFLGLSYMDFVSLLCYMYILYLDVCNEYKQRKINTPSVPN